MRLALKSPRGWPRASTQSTTGTAGTPRRSLGCWAPPLRRVGLWACPRSSCSRHLALPPVRRPAAAAILALTPCRCTAGGRRVAGCSVPCSRPRGLPAILRPWSRRWVGSICSEARVRYGLRWRCISWESPLPWSARNCILNCMPMGHRRTGLSMPYWPCVSREWRQSKLSAWCVR